MTTWTSDELDSIDSVDELQIASLRRDGSLSSSRIIWMVVVDGELYVRSVRGPDAAWFRSTQVRHQGRIEAGGVTRDVSYARVDPELDDRIDAAYRRKYSRYATSIVDSTTSRQARSTTLRLIPR
jgi:hypothetical protein